MPEYAPSHSPATTDRTALWARLASGEQVDLLVIGGGATGLGIALDAAVRGLRVVLLEAHDFAKGTSSRATKLVHGGVRYLAQGHLALVREALHERAALLRNAPHLTAPLSFVMPGYGLAEMALYGAGLAMYDTLAGQDGLGGTRLLSARQVRDMVPNVQASGLRGGVQYWDGQFDDARLALALARTAARHGALLLNHCRVEALLHDAQGRACGVQAVDAETGQRLDCRAACVVNATGVWVDALRNQRDADASRRVSTPPLVTASQGVHLVVDRSFWPSEHALLIPRTRDGRILFAVPWQGKVILGTTDTPRKDMPLEPQADPAEIDFILREAGRYLRHAPRRADVRSVWAGLRPLVRPTASATAHTAQISRQHHIEIAANRLVSVTGGKWTTYRAMAEDVLYQCQMAGLVPVAIPACTTASLPMVGAPVAGPSPADGIPVALAAYGTEAAFVQTLPGHDHTLHTETGLTEAMVRFAVRHEYARTVEDVLARRSRLLFLDAVAATQLAQPVADIVADELHTDAARQAQDFSALATRYQLA
ncbi:glycerol-3-phosphate dehydrogenase [Lampropedia hyalina DSM 16112]|jgi:glycerol-3-phosphate dehydrogenase|uniref:Glycerol-3-phosphate dehydrogenase n=1 Tax=Lampropedia hyalina DSM 16112 TaxID=1122156 RepID=A0A1M5A2S6_9BURK|nr:glycerol-3-phosphate dehydrogenase/oxidase [Lampropedia hyalina]SHF24236.1 glycerol-3-phosphate dehydrogenase [Lampropedia hyalina DSM 16112]